jgi:hypothetical protein
MTKLFIVLFMSKYIGQYSSISSLSNTDLFLVQSGLTYYKLTFSDLEANLDTLPSQTGNNGKYLTTDGTTASWATVSGGTWGSITGTLTAQTDLTTYLSTNYQPLDATLTALAGLATGANKIPYSTGTDVFGQLDFSTNTSLGTSDITIPSQKAIKAYVDVNIVAASVPAKLFNYYNFI